MHEAIGYFERAVTRHFLDEEGSVFPRLSTRRPELAEALALLSAEHPAQIALQNAVAEAAKLLDGDARQGAGKALLEVAEYRSRAETALSDLNTREQQVAAARKAKAAAPAGAPAPAEAKPAPAKAAKPTAKPNTVDSAQ